MFKKYSQKTFLILITIIFNIFFTQKNAKADFERKVIWGMEATINDKPIELLYYDSIFCDYSLGWTRIGETFTFTSPQKWADDNKKNFFSKEAIINLHQLDPTIKSSINIKDHEVKFYFPGILINKDAQLDEKSDDKIIIKRIYIKIDNNAVFLSKKEFEKVKNSYSGFFKITAQIESPEYYIIDEKPFFITKSEFEKLKESDKNIKNAYSRGSPIEVTRSLIFLYSDKKYSQNELSEIIKIEANSILKPEGDDFVSKQFPPEKLIKEYDLIRNNLKYFKEILLEKYGIIILDFVNSRS
jgi:hypothetical protein